jgi:hypothetical protein
MAFLEEVGIAKEVTGKKRSRVFGSSGHLAILDEGTEAHPDERRRYRSRTNESESERGGGGGSRTRSPTTSYLVDGARLSF